jgi:hypothetical protein
MKFTIEIIVDNYCHLLEDRYFNRNNKMMCPLLAFIGNLAMLKEAVKKCPIDWYTVHCAAYSGHSFILDWIKLYDSSLININDIILGAAITNQLSVFKWAKNNNYDIPQYILSTVVIKCKSYDILQWFLVNYPTLFNDESVCGYASICTLQFMLDNSLPINHDLIVSRAAARGHTNIFDWCVKNDIVVKDIIYSDAAKSNRVNVFDWLWKHGYSISDDVWTVAISYKNIKILQWALDNNCINPDTIYNKAVDHCAIDVIQ